MKEREGRQKQRQELLAQLTAMDVAVPTLAQLREGCGKSHYRLALLLMLQATITPDLDTTQRHKLMEVSAVVRGERKALLSSFFMIAGVIWGIVARGAVAGRFSEGAGRPSDNPLHHHQINFSLAAPTPSPQAPGRH